MARTLLENANYINSTIKPAIKSAIIAQGVSVSDSDSFLDYATKIAMIGGGGGGAYELWDYIQSDGTQYINTGRQVSANDVIKCTYMPLSGASFEYWNYVWGCFTSGNMTGVALITSSLKALYTNGSESRVSYSQNAWCFEEIITANAAVNADLYVFSYSNTTAGASTIRLYSFAINNNYYLPCRRKSDGAFGLWDVTNQTFLGDAAGGNAFTGGNKIMNF